MGLDPSFVHRDWQAEGAAPIMDIIFDSGAFSAWKLGKPINLGAYCDYLARNAHWMQTYIALDEIIPHDPNEAAKRSFANYLAMRKQGLRPMPVFHAMEDIEWLYRLIDAGADYIGLAGLSLNSHATRLDWYQLIFDKMTDASGKPYVKFHALGEGRFDALSRFPWYSADSTSWVYAAQRNGIIPVEGNRGVAMRNDYLNDKAKPDMDWLFGDNAAFFADYLARHKIKRRVFETRGPEAMVIRTYLALMYYLDQERRVNALCPISHRRSRLFANPGANAFQGSPTIDLPHIKYYSVLGNNYITWAVMEYAQARRGLVSYFYVEGAGALGYNSVLADYVYNPKATVQEHRLIAKSYNILKEYIDAE